MVCGFIEVVQSNCSIKKVFFSLTFIAAISTAAAIRSAAISSTSSSVAGDELNAEIFIAASAASSEGLDGSGS